MTLFTRFLLGCLLCMASGQAIAQTTDKPMSCASDKAMDKWLQTPAGRQMHQQIEQQLLQYRQSNPSARRPNAVVTLPIVIHIIHNNGAENISDAQAIQGVQFLNQAFANTGFYDPTDGVDCQIQFCLARRDPNGNATTGITRNVSTLTNMDMNTDDIALKDLNRWNPLCYVNVWLVKEICSGAGGCGVAGYAYFPSAHGQNMDGIVMEANYFGSSAGNTGVLVHEMGHYLGLYHTFQGACTNNNCLTDGDKVCDTPPDQSTNVVPCNGSANSCTTDVLSGFTTDQNDLHRDFMDYGNPSCFSMFTQGQADRMNWHITNVRSSLLNCTSCLDPCPAPVTADYTTPGATVNAGSAFTFTNTSANATNGYEWYVNGVLQSTATNFNYTFAAVGSYIIKLVAKSTNPLCGPAEKTFTVQAVCPVTASFTKSAATAPCGTNINFTNTSVGANTYEWFVNGVSQATTTNFAYTNTVAGKYVIKLIARNTAANCTQTITDTVEYTCPITVAISPQNPNVFINTTVNFSATAPGATTFQWLLNNIPATNNTTYSFTPVSAGNYVVTLIAGNGICSVSQSVFLSVKDTCLRTTFQKRFGGSGNDLLADTKATPDGGFVYTGYTNSFGAGLYDGIVVKTDAMGNIQWSTLVGGASNDYLNKVITTSDGGYLAAGYTSSFGARNVEGWMVKLNSTGVVQWSRKYSNNNPDGSVIWDVCQTSDGGYAFAGVINYTPGLADAMVGKTDANGVTQWCRNYSGSSSDQSFGVLEDNGVLVVSAFGAYLNGSTYYDGVFMKVDRSNGNVLSATRYEIENRSNWFTNIYKQGNDYLIGCNNTDNFNNVGYAHILLRVDNNGLVKQITRANSATDKSGADPFTPTADGGYLLAQSENNGAADIHLRKNTPLGTLQWLKKYGTAGNNDLLYGLIQTPDLSFAGAGRTGTAANGDFYIIKTDVLGESGGSCPSAPTDGSNATPLYGAANFAWPIIGNIIIPQNNTVNAISSRANLTATDICVGTTCVPSVDTCFGSFQKTYGGAGDEAALCTQKVPGSNTGYIVAGRTSSYGSGGQDAYLLRLSSNGEVLWAKAYGGTGNDYLTNVKPTATGGFIAVGRTQSFVHTSGAMYIINTDADGNLLWSRTFGNGTLYGEIGHTIVQTADGGFAAVGTYDSGPGNADILVVRLDGSGNLLWSKRFNSGTTDEGLGILEDNDTLVVSGYYRGGNFHDGVLMKINKATGDPYWIKAYDVNNDNNGFYYLQKIPNGYSVMGSSSNGFTSNGTKQAQLRFNLNGNVTYSHQLTGSLNKPTDRIFYSNDGGSLSAASEGNGNDDIYFYKVNEQKQPIWKKRFTRPGNQNIYFITEDGNSVVMTGLTSTTVGGQTDILFIKTTASGNTPGCTTDSTDALIDNPIVVAVNYSPSVSAATFNAAVNPATIVTNTLPTMATPCATSGCDTIDVNGNSAVCLSGDTVFYTAMRSASCNVPVQWITDPTQVQVIATTDTTIKVKFLQAGATRIYANLSTGCKVLTDSIAITVTNCIDTTACGSYFSGTYQAPVDFVSMDVQPSVGRGFVAAGYRTNASTGNDAVLMRINNSGVPVWTRLINGSGDDRYVKVKEMSNGQLVAIGYSNSFGLSGRRILISYYTASGNLIWNRIINSSVATDESFGVGIEEAPNGDILYYGKLNNGPGNAIIAGRMNAAGANVWVRRIAVSAPAYTITPTASALQNDSLVIAGNLNTGQNIGFVLKQSLTTLGGVNAYYIQHPSASPLLVNGMTKTTSGLDVSMSANSIATILALNDNMSIKLQRIFSSFWFGSPYYYTAPTPDNGHISLAYRTDNNLAMAKTDSIGQLEWIRRVDEGTAAGLANVKAIPGGYVWSGTIQAGALKQTKIVKMGTDTRLGVCTGDYPITSTLSSPGLTVAPIAGWSSNAATTSIVESINTLINGETTPYFTVCSRTTLCDTLKITGFDSACNLADTLVYQAYRNPLCNLPVTWQVDPAFGQVISHTDTTIKIKWLQTGTVKLYASMQTACSLLKDSLTILLASSPDSVNIGPDRQVCDGSTITLRAGPGFKSYVWQDGTADSIYTATYPGIYHVTVEDYCGNQYSDTMVITLAPAVPFDLGPDLVRCNNDTVTITAPAGFTGYSWAPNYNISSQQGQIVKVWPAIDTVYSVIATSSPGCLVYDTIRVTVGLAPLIHLGNDTSLCQGGSLLLDAGTGFTNYVWSMGAGSQTITVNTAGQYWVRGTTAQNCIVADTLNILNVFANPVVHLGNDTSLCQGSSLLLDGGAGMAHYLWSTGAITQTINANTVGQYWVRVTNANNCIGRDTMNILNVYPRPTINLGNDTSFCQGGSIVLNAGAGFANYVWSTGAGSSSITANTAGQYWVRGTTAQNCIATDTLNILNVFANPVVNLGNDTSLCQGSSLLLNAGAGMTNYVWSTGASSPTITVNTVGQYWAHVTDANNCRGRDTMNVLNIHPQPTVFIGNDTSFCQGGSVVLNAGAGFSNYVWSTGANTPTITASTANLYWVQVSNGFGCTNRDSMRVLAVFPAYNISLGNDTVLCAGSNLTLSPGNSFTSYLWQDGSTGNTITVNAVGEYWAQVVNADGCKARDTMRVRRISPLPVNFAPTNIGMCNYEPILVRSLGNYDTYLWSTGSTVSNTLITAPGNYWLTVTNADGCEARENFVVFDKNCRIGVYFPNAFSPGGDGRNDVYRPGVYGQLEYFSMEIYNRYGERIFRTTDASKGWDGTYKGQPQNIGAYVWMSTYKLKDMAAVSEKGSVVLIR